MFRSIHNTIHNPIIISTTLIVGAGACWRQMIINKDSHNTPERILNGAIICGIGGIAGFIIGKAYPFSFPIIATSYCMHQLTKNKTLEKQ